MPVVDVDEMVPIVDTEFCVELLIEGAHKSLKKSGLQDAVVKAPFSMARPIYDGELMMLSTLILA